ncbi:MAG: ABC transporter ATP-binding protein [Actinomycetia bacterium]|nr:ABC transporter ATP-binding protein [Actinomycetes bacterium]
MSTSRSLHWRATARLIRPDAGRYAALSVIVMVSAIAALAGPVILRELIDRAGQGATLASLVALAVVYLLTAVGSQLAALGVSVMTTATAWHTANSLRLQLTDHVLGLDHEFHRSHSPGELIERIDGDVTSVSDFLAVVLVRVLSAVFLIVGAVAVVATIEWWLGVGMATYAAVVALIVFVHRNQAVAESADEMSASAVLYGGIEERLTASEDLRANGAGPYAVARFVADTSRYIEVVVRRERAFLRMWRRLQLSIMSGAALALVVGAAGMQLGFLTIGSAFLLFQYSRRIQNPLEEISHELDLVQKANGAMSRVVNLLATESTIGDEGKTSPPAGPLSIDFEQVGFDYGDGLLVLDGIDMTIGAGRSVGIVGHTGSGKTTLSRLLVRLIEATSGQLRLGGVAIADISMTELRRRVAYVPQAVDLLSGSIRDNLTMYNPDFAISDSRIDTVLREVGLERFSGEAKYQLLGPAGTGLSAGEGQLLALARVWLRQPDLVVLDEPTSRVDPETEIKLEAAIAALSADRTVVIVAHRLSTLRHVDEIVVVEGGKVVELGPRAQLVADEQSRYHQLLASGLELEKAEGVNP